MPHPWLGERDVGSPRGAGLWSSIGSWTEARNPLPLAYETPFRKHEGSITVIHPLRLNKVDNRHPPVETQP